MRSLMEGGAWRGEGSVQESEGEGEGKGGDISYLRKGKGGDVCTWERGREGKAGYTGTIIGDTRFDNER